MQPSSPSRLARPAQKAQFHLLRLLPTLFISRVSATKAVSEEALNLAKPSKVVKDKRLVAKEMDS